MTDFNIPQEHIDRLTANPAEAALFDEIYGAGASTKYLQEEETTEVDKQPVKGFVGNTIIGAKEAIRETLETLEGLSDAAEENLPMGGLTFGSEASNGFIEYLNPEEYKKKIGGDLEKDEGLFQQAADLIPESGEPEGVVGSLSRGVSQFVTGFVGGGYVLKGLGWAKKAKDGYNIGRSFVQGGIADFAVFDEHEARLADFIIDAFPAADDTFLAYMAADETDTMIEGKLKNVLEGSLLGGTAELLFKSIRMFRGTRKRLDAGDEKGAKEYAEKQAKEIEDIKQKANDEIEQTIDPIEAAAKGKKGLPDPNVKPKKFNVKTLKNTDFYKNVQDVIKKIRTGEADIDDLDEIDVSINFIDDVDDAATLIRIISGEVNKITKEFDEVKNHDAVWKQADRMLDDPTTVLVKAQELEKIGGNAPAITTAMRVVFNGVYKRVQRNLNLQQQGKISQEELESSIDLLQSLYRLDRSIGTNTGRALEIRKMLVGSQSKSQTKIKRLLEEADIRPEEGKIELIKKLRKVKDNKKGVMAVLKAAQEKLGINFINKFYINALLSNPKTHAINMTSNTIMALIRPIEQYIGGVLTRDKSARIEAVATAAGIVKYFQDSLIMAREAFRKSDSILDSKNFKVDLPADVFKKGAGVGEKIIEAPTRFLNASDELYKQLSYRSKIYGMAVAEGLRKGLSKKKTLKMDSGKRYSELDRFIEEKFDDAFHPDKSAKNKIALTYAQENTFTKALGQGTLGKTVQSAVNQVPVLRQIMPFVRTPVQIMRAVWDRSPLGIMRKEFRKELFSPDKAIRASAVGKQALGASLFVSAIVLAWNGVITGGVPKDKNLRRQKFDTGWRPYSFHIGDKYYSYERLDPGGAFFGLVADYATIANEITEDERQELADANMMALINQMDAGDYGEVLIGGGIATAQNLASKTYIKSLTDFISALSSGDTKEWKKYGLTKAGSFVPNIIKGIANDPLYREVRNISDTLKTRVGLYGDVDPSFNALGEVRSKGNSFWESFLTPWTITEDINDNVLKEFDRLNQGFAPINSNQGYSSNIDLTEFTKGNKNAYVRFNEILASDGSLRKDLEKLIASDFYQKRLTDNPIDDEQSYKGSKQAYIKQIINKYKKKAKLKLLREGYITSSNLDLHIAFRNDKKNQMRAERGFTLLPTK